MVRHSHIHSRGRSVFSPASLSRKPAGPTAGQPKLPKPFETPSVIKHPKVIGWPKGRTPTAADGLPGHRLRPRTSRARAGSTSCPTATSWSPSPGRCPSRRRRQTPKKKKDEEKKKGLKESKTVTGSSPNRITLLRDADGDGTPEVRETFLEGLNQPFGMALVKDTLFVANTDAARRLPVQGGRRSASTARG